MHLLEDRHAVQIGRQTDRKATVQPWCGWKPAAGSTRKVWIPACRARGLDVHPARGKGNQRDLTQGDFDETPVCPILTPTWRVLETL